MASTKKTETTPEYSTSTDDRYRGPECAHQNSHITEAAARSCSGPLEGPMQTVPRYWGTIDGVRCSCRFGHKTAKTALACVTPAAPKTRKVKPEPETKPEKLATVSKLHSGTEGTAKRS